MALDMTTALTIKANVVGQQKVDKFGKSLGAVEKSSDRATGGLKRLASAGNSLTGVLARVGVAAAAGNFIRSGIEADRTSKRLVNLTKEFGETAKVQAFAADMATRYGLSQVQAANSVSDLFGRLRPMNISLKEIETVFKGVNTAAGRMNLTTADTEGVMLQLSQALGSGRLQGDEFRSIMERLPAIGQAVADSMNVQVSALKKLSSDGMITTDVVIKALEDLASQPPPEVDAYKQFQASLADLSATIGTELLPALTPLIDFTNSLLEAFLQLPGPVKTLVAGVVALGAAFVVLAPAVAAVGPAFAAIGALGLGAKLAALVPIVASIGSALGGLLPILAGIFTGPVGWIALLIGAGVAIYAFRDQIGDALKAIGNFFKAGFEVVGKILKAAAKFYMDFYVTPVLEFGKKLFDGFVGLFKKIADVVKAPFLAVVNFIKGIFNNVLSTIANGINFAVRLVNRLISGFNRLPTPDIPLIPQMTVPQFAKGGVVNGPTLAMVGEGGESEYIVPQSKASGFASNWMAGKRGINAIPGFAEGGVVNPGGGGGTGNTTVQITTGPVLQQEGKQYVTVGDMERALNDFGAAMFKNSRSLGGRRYQGIGA